MGLAPGEQVTAGPLPACPYCRRGLIIKRGRALLHPFTPRPYLVCEGAPRCEYMRPLTKREREVLGGGDAEPIR